jgi:RimJ/RimL family protein N-acetyltransferase
MASGLVFGDDARVLEWTKHFYKIYPMHYNLSVGIVDTEGGLIGAILFGNFNGTNVELNYYGEKTVTLGICRAIARIALTEFNAARVSALTSKRKKHLIAAMQKVGFRLEGAQRCFYGPKDCQRNTAIRLVMFREQIEQMARFKAPAQKVG